MGAFKFFNRNRSTQRITKGETISANVGPTAAQLNYPGGTLDSSPPSYIDLSWISPGDFSITSTYPSSRALSPARERVVGLNSESLAFSLNKMVQVTVIGNGGYGGPNVTFPGSGEGAPGGGGGGAYALFPASNTPTYIQPGIPHSIAEGPGGPPAPGSFPTTNSYMRFNNPTGYLQGGGGNTGTGGGPNGPGGPGAGGSGTRTATPWDPFGAVESGSPGGAGPGGAAAGFADPTTWLGLSGAAIARQVPYPSNPSVRNGNSGNNYGGGGQGGAAQINSAGGAGGEGIVRIRIFL